MRYREPIVAYVREVRTALLPATLLSRTCVDTCRHEPRSASYARAATYNAQAMDMVVVQRADVCLGKCGHVSRGTRLRVGPDTLLVR